MAWTEKYITHDASGGDGSSGSPWTLSEGISNAVAGYRMNIKVGAYTYTTSDGIFSTAGTVTTPIWWRGYKSTIGDLDDSPTTTRVVGTDIPDITFTSGQLSVTGGYQWFSNLSVKSTGGDQTFDVSSNYVWVHRCRFENTGTGTADYAYFSSSGNSHTLSECYLKATASSSYVVRAQRSAVHFINCYITGGGYNLIVQGGVVVMGNILDGAGTRATYLGAADNIVVGNDIYNPGGDGIYLAGTTPNNAIYNNLFHTIQVASKVGILAGTSGVAPWRFNNAFYQVTDPESGLGNNTDEDFNRIVESADPLTAPGSGDFTMTASAASKGSGSPTLFEGVSLNSSKDRGAVQRQSPTTLLSKKRAGLLGR